MAKLLAELKDLESRNESLQQTIDELIVEVGKTRGPTEPDEIREALVVAATEAEGGGTKPTTAEAPEASDDLETED